MSAELRRIALGLVQAAEVLADRDQVGACDVPERDAQEDAEDTVQGFLSTLLARPAIAGVDQARGRFRSYLLGALRNYVGNVRVKARAKKRGGDAAHVPLSVAVAAVNINGDFFRSAERKMS